jgi:hypothetical protein
MPVTYEIDVARGLVRTTCTGFVILDEVMAHFADLERDPRRPEMLNVVLDLRGVTSIPETGEVRKIAVRIGPPSPLKFGVCAIVAQDPLAVGTAKLFAVFAREHFRATAVVPTIAAANEWLQQQI